MTAMTVINSTSEKPAARDRRPDWGPLQGINFIAALRRG